MTEGQHGGAAAPSMTSVMGRPNYPPVAPAVAAVARRVKLAVAGGAGGAAGGAVGASAVAAVARHVKLAAAVLAVGASAVAAVARRVKLAVAGNAGGAAGESASVELGGEILRPPAFDLATFGGVNAREVLRWVLAVEFDLIRPRVRCSVFARVGGSVAALRPLALVLTTAEGSGRSRDRRRGVLRAPSRSRVAKTSGKA